MRMNPRQDGAATLVVAVVLLVAVTLAVLFTASTAIMETRMSANEVRAKQAHAAAQAGIDHAIALVRTAPIPSDLSAIVNDQDRYRFRFCRRPEDLVADDQCSCGTEGPSGRTAVVYSCGRSDDGSAVQRLSIAVSSPGVLPPGGPPAAPLISRGNANVLTGGATIINYYTNLTVWTGQSVLGQSNTSTTLIRDANAAAPTLIDDPTDANDPPRQIWTDAPEPGTSPGCNNPPTGYVCTSRGSNFGPDVIDADTSLSALSDADYFERFFGAEPDAYRDAILPINKTSPYGTLSGLAGVIPGQVFWIDGDVTLDRSLGTVENPVVLIVDGDLAIGSNHTIHGVVAVTGDASGSGTPTIRGSLIVGGQSNFGGGGGSGGANVKLIYDPNVILRATEDTKGFAGGTIPATWRDWL